MQAQSKAQRVFAVLVTVGFIALFIHLGIDLMHSSQCATDYYATTHNPPSQHVVTTVDGAVASDTYRSVAPTARYEQMQAEARARFAANGCVAEDYHWQP